MSPIVGKYFPAQRSDERVFLLLRRHWFTYAIFLFIAFVMAIPLLLIIIYGFINPEIFSEAIGSIIILFGSAYTLIILGLMLFGFIDYYLDVYLVTNKRIVDIKQNGFFKRSITELHLRQLEDINASVGGLFPTFFHYGDIVIQTAGPKANFYFKSIPHPYRVSKLIIDLHEAQIGRKKNLSKRGKNELLSHQNKDKLSQARKETKKFFDDEDYRGGVIIDDEVFDMETKEILKGVNSDEESAEKNKDVVVKNINNKTDEEKVVKRNGTEMHENEEIDI